MNAAVCPTIDAETPEAYAEQIRRVAPFAHRLHIDVADGSMTPNALLAIPDIWWPGGVRADIHVMYRQPSEHLAALIALGPQLVIFHAEAQGDFVACARQLQHHGIEAGVALLPETSVQTIVPGLEYVDYALVFSGSLGHFGGTADEALLSKVKELRTLKPQLEIGWDGGVNADNAARLVAAGVQVLNTGGAIHQADDPAAAYATLDRIARG